MEQITSQDSFNNQDRWDNLRIHGPFVLALILFICCLIIELLQIRIPLEIRNRIYSILGTAVLVLSILLNTLYGKKFNISIETSFLGSAITFYVLLSLISVGWTHLENFVLGYGSIAAFRCTLLIPLFGLFFSRIFKLDLLTTCDYFTPYIFFQHGTVTVACWISGCCAGKEMLWGIYNPYTERLTFPAQPYVILLSLAVALWGLLYAKKHSYITTGKVYTTSLIVYGLFRYLLEFFTDDNRILGPWSLFSIYALLMVMLGSAMQFVLYIKSNRQRLSNISPSTSENTNHLMEEKS